MLPSRGALRSTSKQIDYSIHLLERLEETHNVETERFRRRIKGCTSRQDMSGIIGDMLKLLRETEEDYNG